MTDAEEGQRNLAATAKNYQYWQEHGSDWPEIYAWRKRFQPEYHIQELMLASYFSAVAPARVLEYGCGYGRHLSYLSQIPGLDVYGVDQSPSMLSRMQDWASEDWIEGHVSQIAPIGQLGFPDGHFDVVYTAEVLVHVRPEDIETILGELVRIAKWHILHIETSPHHVLCGDAQDGCWMHDLPSLYRKLGYSCELLPSGYATHTPYRVPLDNARSAPQLSAISGALFSRLDEDLRAGIQERDERIADSETQLSSTKSQLESLERARDEDLAKFEQRLAAEETRAAKLERKNAELQLQAQTAIEQLNAVKSRLQVASGRADDTEPDVVSLEETIQRIQQSRFELDYIKDHLTYRLGARLRATPVWRVGRWLKNRNRGLVTLRATGVKHADSKGSEVWLLAARNSSDSPAIPWDFLETRATVRRQDPGSPYGQVMCIIGGGSIRVPVGGTFPAFTLLMHPWSGQVEVTYRGQARCFDLYSPETTALDVVVSGDGIRARGPTTSTKVTGRTGPHLIQRERSLGEEERAWLEHIEATKPRALAVHTPRWLGITASTVTLFEEVFPYPSTPDQDPYHWDAEDLRHQAGLIVQSGIRHVVFSGGDEAHFRLAQQIKTLEPGVRCDLLWHGSYVQFSEDYGWHVLKLWLDGTQDGMVHTIGTVKKGMEQFFQSCGYRSKFVMNAVPTIPEGPATPDRGGPYLGMWISGNSYRKIPHAMLAAAKLVEGACLRAANVDDRSAEVIDYFRVKSDGVGRQLLQSSALLDQIRRTHLSLYVTFSECCPMLPLESLSVGVPCLVGPTSHLFEDHEYLHSRLVVPYPDRAECIAGHIDRALDERTDIVTAYRDYAPAYIARSKESLDRFLAE